MTIREIAKHINCSPSTVYRAINNPDSVSIKIKEQVDSLLRDNNKNPKKILQTYVVFPQMNEFYSSLLVELSKILISEGIQVIPFISNEDSTQEEIFLNKINFSTKTALVWNPVNSNSQYQFLSRKHNRPKVIILNRSHNVYRNDIFISYANKEAIQTAIDILSKNGAKNILFVSSNIINKTITERNEAFLNHISENEFLEGDILYTDFLNWKNAYQDIYKQQSIFNKYDAVISGSEAIGYAFFKLFYVNPKLRSSIQFITFDYSSVFEIISFSMIYFPINFIAQKTATAILNSQQSKPYEIYILPQIQLSAT